MHGARITSSQIRGWVFLVFNSPLIGFWLLQLIVIIAGVARGISHPSLLLVYAGLLGTLDGIVRLVARAKGIDPRPPSLHALSSSPPPTLPPASAPTSRAVRSGWDF